MRKLKEVCEFIYLRWPRRYILSNVSLTRRFTSMPNGYTLGLIVEIFVSHPGFKWTFIQCSGGIYTKPKDFQIEGYSSTKRVIEPTASLSP